MSTQQVSAHWVHMAQILRQHSVRHVFGLPGDDLQAWRALTGAGLDFHLTGDQRHGGYQAVATVQAGTQPLGVLVLGKGPALTHAATAILEAREQRLPLLVVSSGVGPARQGTGAFQELDAAAVLAPLTVARRVAVKATDVPQMTQELIREAMSGRRGPVHLEIPEDLESMEEPTTHLSALHSSGGGPGCPPVDRYPQEQLPRVSELVHTARRPALLVGGGAHHTVDPQRVHALARRWGIPLLSTASGRGVVDEDDELFLGLAGLYLPTAAQEVMDRVDVLISLGSRLEETATLGWNDRTLQVVQVNVDPGDFSTRFRGETVQAKAAAYLEALERAGRPAQLDPALAQQARQAHQRAAKDAQARPSALARMLSALRDTAPDDLFGVHENGLQDIWSYICPVWSVRAGMDCLVPSEQTPLGYGVSAALGLARVQKRPVLAIVGDTAFRTLGTEWDHLRQLRAPLVYAVLDNGGSGWLQANLEMAEPRTADLTETFCRPSDLVPRLAQAAGMHVVRVGPTSRPEAAAEAIWKAAVAAHRRDRALVVHVPVDLRDVPPGFEELAGDVPSWAVDAQREHPVSASATTTMDPVTALEPAQ